MSTVHYCKASNALCMLVNLRATHHQVYITKICPQFHATHNQYMHILSANFNQSINPAAMHYIVSYVGHLINRRFIWTAIKFLQPDTLSHIQPTNDGNNWKYLAQQ